MNETNSLAVSVAILAGVSVWVTDLLAIPTWLVFLAWLTFFFCGLGRTGLLLQLSSNVWGIVVGVAALYAISQLGASILVPVLVVAVAAFLIAQSARLRVLSQSPGSFVGFAMIAAAVQTTGLPIASTAIDGPVVTALAAAILGSSFGVASQAFAWALVSLTGGRRAGHREDQRLLPEG